MAGLDERALKRISGPAWQEIRPLFDRINEALLSVCADATGQLVTNYIKYIAPNHCGIQPYAVLWVRKSTELVLGLRLPDTYDSPHLASPPGDLIYSGLNRYFHMDLETNVPDEIDDWAKAAFSHAKSAKS